MKESGLVKNVALCKRECASGLRQLVGVSNVVFLVEVRQGGYISSTGIYV